jgi:chromosome segregation ATPase
LMGEFKMNKLQMNLLSLLAQVGFADISKEQVREQIENNFTGKAEALASVKTLLEIEASYKELTAQVKADVETAREEYSQVLKELNQLDVTGKDAVSKMMELETKKTQIELKLQASGRVIKAMEDKKEAELIAELPNTYKVGLTAKSQAHLLLGQIAKIVNPFNVKLLSEVLAEVDAEMDAVDKQYHRVARETGALGTAVNGVYLHERDLFTTMAIELKGALRK